MPGIERVTPQMTQLLDVLIADPDAQWWGLALAAEAAINTPTVYRSLARLEAAGWVSSTWEDADPAEQGRPRRRMYRLTPSGAREATRLLAEQHAKAARRRPAALPRLGLQPGGAST